MGRLNKKLALKENTKSKSKLDETHSKLTPNVMENLLLRFPGVGEGIFRELDNQTLTKCKEVGRCWKKFLGQNKLIPTRKIMKYHKNHQEFIHQWKAVMLRVSQNTFEHLAFSVEKFYTNYTKRLQFQHSPLHIAAEHGSFHLFKFAYDRHC